MKMHDHWQDRLSEYLDGDLAADDRAALEEHLDACDDCRTTLVELRTLVSAARNLGDQPPPPDLWPGIRERILSATAEEATSPAPAAVDHDPAIVHLDRYRHQEHTSREHRAPSHKPARRISFTIPQLAAASVALILLTGGIFRLLGPAPGSEGGLAHSEPEPARLEITGQGNVSVPMNAGAPGNLHFAGDLAGGQYDAAIADLERALAEGRRYLAPATIEVIEKNLAIIDRAIEEARSALADDPANIYLTNYLTDTMRRKLELLRYTNAIIQAQS